MENVFDVSVDGLGLAGQIVWGFGGAVRVVGYLTGQVEQAAAVDNDSLAEILTVGFEVDAVDEWFIRERFTEVCGECEFEGCVRVGQAIHKVFGDCGL